MILRKARRLEAGDYIRIGPLTFGISARSKPYEYPGAPSASDESVVLVLEAQDLKGDLTIRLHADDLVEILPVESQP